MLEIKQDIKSLAVYYGDRFEDNLLNYDMLVLEPKGQSIENILSLKKSGKVLIAYISMIEINKYDTFIKNLKYDDFIFINGETAYNERFNTYYMKILKPNVKKIIINQVIKCIKMGYDGIFIDTLDSLEYLPIDTLTKVKMMLDVKNILKEIKLIYNNAIIIQNNGFNEIYEYTTPYISGICFENPPCSSISNFVWSIKAFKKLDKLKKEYSLKLLLLQEVDKKLTYKQKLIRKIAKLNNYLCYNTINNYTKI